MIVEICRIDTFKLCYELRVLRLRVLSLSKESSVNLSFARGKNLKTYSLLVYRVNVILYCSALTLLTAGTISAYSVMQIEQRELKKKRRGMENVLFCIFGDDKQLEQERA
jgi:hypothetical protein